MKIVRKLDEWNRAGLLDDAQVSAITRYEAEHAGGAQWGVWGIGAVGALAITVGIVSVISANWDGIPTWLKLFSALTLTLGTLAGAWRTASLASPWPRDIFLFLHSGLNLAMVGLIAQTFHLHGHAWRGPALCAVLAIPAAVIAARSLLTYVVLGHVTLAGFLVLDGADWIEGDGIAIRFLAAAFGVALLAGARLLAAHREDAAAALQRWAFGVLFAVAAVSCAAWGQSSRWSSRPEEGAVVVGVALFVLAAAIYAVLELATPATGRAKRFLALALFVVLVTGGAIVSATVGYPGSEALWRQLLGFAISCAVCIAVAVAASHAGSRRGTNLATLALALRILVLYLELAKDLMTTGAGLIGTGLVFLGLAYGWWRLRRVLPVASKLAPEAA